MNELIIRIESIDEFNRRIVDGVKSKASGAMGFSFLSYADMQSTLTNNRMDILRVLMRGESLGVRDLARALGKDSGNVTRDLKALTDRDLVHKTEDGRYAVEFDRIRFDCSVEAAA